MLAEALAQYRAHPGDYLEGAVVGLMRSLELEADRSWCDDAAQNRNADGRPPQQRVRDYINGTKAALAWAMGTSASPPLSIVLTAPQGDQPASPPDGRE
ncbi:MAG TPA: hypothetical protein DGG94_07280 [Micromonosporaceae bacterium]|nr:hypothetical protein [Micromonosporaceae bacterium]